MQNKYVAILGNGGREYALAVGLAKEAKVHKIYYLAKSENAGLSDINKVEYIPIDYMDINQVVNWAQKRKKGNALDLVVVGPEAPLERGVVDALKNSGIIVFGPDKEQARLETDKAYARKLFKQLRVPQPKFFICHTKEEARQARSRLKSTSEHVVVKYTGLASGKGVMVCANISEFEQALVAIFDLKRFSTSNEQIHVVVEECIGGQPENLEEISVFAICDGKNFKIIGTAQDYKRAYDNDRGPNTGGKGSFAPASIANKRLIKIIKKKFIKPILKKTSFKGALYLGLGLPIDNINKPQLIEINARFGDPETQVIIPLLESSLYNLLFASAVGTIRSYKLKIKNLCAVSVVLTFNNYPLLKEYPVVPIVFDTKSNDIVYHAGTQKIRDTYYTLPDCGRVLNAIGIGETLELARARAYDTTKNIKFPHMDYRRDIADKGIEYIQKQKEKQDYHNIFFPLW